MATNSENPPAAGRGGTGAGRRRVLLLDSAGFEAYVDDSGGALFDADRYEVTLLTRPERAAAPLPPWLAGVVGVDPASLTDQARVRSCLGGLGALDHVVTVEERLLGAAARIRQEFGLAGYSLTHVSLLTDLDLMRCRLILSGIPVVEYALTSRPGESDLLFARYGAIDLRPVDRVSPALRYSARSRSEWACGVRSAQAAAEPYLAERRLDGPRYQVLSNTLRRPGPAVVCVTRDDGDRAGSADAPAAVLGAGAQRDRLLDLNRRVLDALSWHSGLLWAQIESDGQGRLALNQVSVVPGRARSSVDLRREYGVCTLRTLLAAQVQGMAGFPSGRSQRASGACHKPIDRG